MTDEVIIGQNAVLWCRVSDNVLEAEDFPTRRLLVNVGSGIIDVQEGNKGVYDQSGMPEKGWTLDRLLEWASYDPTGHHPEIGHDLKAEGDSHYTYSCSERSLNEILDRGREKWQEIIQTHPAAKKNNLK